MANSIDGDPVKMPIWVALRFKSSWMSGMTGGTAKIVSRRATPVSQSSISDVRRRACAGASIGRFMKGADPASSGNWRVHGAPNPARNPFAN